jgi:hypothetical protein
LRWGFPPCRALVMPHSAQAPESAADASLAFARATTAGLQELIKGVAFEEAMDAARPSLDRILAALPSSDRAAASEAHERFMSMAADASV